MVNLISTPSTRSPDTSLRAAGAASVPGPAIAGQGAHPKMEIPGGAAEAQLPKGQQVKAAIPAGGGVPTGAAPTPPLVPPLTSLALFRDAESGMAVSVVRDRVSGAVVEQVPTERARRLAAMMRQQEALVGDVQQERMPDGPHVDMKT